jgi:hypothetical protein
MDKRIILTSLFVALIFSSFIIYSSFAQTTNLPICITPEKYLAWPNFVKYNVPVASTTPGFLTVSPIYVSSTNVGIGTNNPQARLHVEGRIYQTGLGGSTFFGFEAGLNDNLNNRRNTFIGYQAGRSNTSGYSNTALGFQALYSNTTGGTNIAIGNYALYSNTTGYSNTAIGNYALYSNTTGSSNTAIGNLALYSNTTGVVNIALGNYALYRNTTGRYNTAIGNLALYHNTTGGYNTAIGYDAGSYIADGATSNAASTNSVYLGAFTKASFSGATNEIVIGYNAVGAGSNSVVLGNDNITKTILKGNVGIGTTTPQVKLHVIGDILSSNKVTANQFCIGNSCLNQWPSQAAQYWTLSGNNLYTSSTNWNVGIGTTTPSEKLYVAGGNIGLDVVNGGGIKIGTQARFGVDNTNQATIRIGTGGLRILNNAQNYVLATIQDGNYSNALFINSSGNVGIGTTTPQVKLHVIGDILSSNKVTANQFCIGNSCLNQWPSQAAQYWTLSGNNLYTSSTNWNVGIGTNNPQAKLDVVGEIKTTGLSVGGYSGTVKTSTGLGVYGHSEFQNNLVIGGNVGIGTTTPQAKLHVIGDILSSNKVTANQFCIGNSCLNQWPSQAAQYWTLSGNNLYTSSTNWNVGIGTTTPPVYKLYIYNTNPNLYGSLGATTIVDSPAFVYGVVGSSHNTNVNGPAIGVYGWASSSNASYGVYGVGYGPSGTGVRAYGEKYNIFAANSNAFNIFYGNVGIETINPQAKLEVAGAIRLTPTSQPSNATTGMMYFDQSSGVFKCFQKDPEDNLYKWMNCTGKGPGPGGTATLTVPVRIYDSTGQRVVLEINEEY